MVRCSVCGNPLNASRSRRTLKMPLLHMAYMSDLTQQACSAWRTMCNNHLIYAAYRHMAMMLIALFWDDYLDNDEAYQLAKHIGRCRDTVASRERNKTVVKLPKDRPAQSHVKWRGAIVDRPEMTQQKWAERVQRLRSCSVPPIARTIC